MKKAKSTSPKAAGAIKKEEFFGYLVKNAFNFLDKAALEFEEEPKYSVIHFYSAIELFLKARLLHEHWTLILTKPDDANLDNFKKGDFHSVSLKNADKRLTAILQNGLHPNELNCFLELGKHRNQMVHFFHIPVAQQNKKEEINDVVAQQCRAWFYLHHILTAHDRWSSVFISFKGEIAEYNKTMQGHKKYLEAKYKELKGEVDAEKKAGLLFHECPSCGQPTLKEDSSRDPFLIFQCLVCDFSANGVKIECPNCKAMKTLISEPWDQCRKCRQYISGEDVKEFLTADHGITKDTMYDPHEVNCGVCDMYHSVVSVDEDLWLCTNCFATCKFEDIGTCEWCNEYTTADVEDSRWRGCSHCEDDMKSYQDRN
ncbi:MAG: hypothetical protein OEZ04_11680 [Nitrospinota bacterium]|nr:hypothetical protein [Nitrospinota bacterium]